MQKKSVFIVGAKSLGNYGGFETFVNKLTEYHKNEKHLKYYVACKANGDGAMDEKKLKGAKILSGDEFIYNNAYCFKIKVPQIGPAQAIYYDIKSLDKCIEIIKKENIKNPIVYILACRIGPFMKHYVDIVHKYGGKVFINPDGHEWMRAKWSMLVKKYWKYSESQMVRYADLVICDSKCIEKYIHDEYDGKCVNGNPKTTYIAYGAEIRKSKIKNNDKIWIRWLKDNKVKQNNYYLIVGRFVPENNYETMLREFMLSDTKKDLVIITNKNTNIKFYNKLNDKLDLESDKRIKFVGTVYDEELLRKIRENAHAYIHGHEVGGTNPSLLEALASTNLNLLLDVGFNSEVDRKRSVYWTKSKRCLAKKINATDIVTVKMSNKYHKEVKEIIKKQYSWSKILYSYKEIFNGGFR